jgi:CubicO group peptidase (beta-lactamase class C family)
MAPALGSKLHMRTQSLIVILSLTTAVVAGHSAPMPRATPESVGLSSERLQAVTALLRQFVADRRIAGAVAGVARRGKVVYLESVGLQSRETKAPMTERTLFRVYSMTKAVTGVAVMMLADEGKLRLDDEASRYLPEFKDVTVGAAESARRPARAITIEDLLLHTSGLSHRTSELLEVRSRAQALPRFVTNITRAPLMEDPGTRFRYSEATTVLGRIVEVVSGQSFDAFVTRRILGPLEMHDTSFWVEPAAAPRLATVYQRTEDGSVVPYEIEPVPFTQKPALMEGAVGLVSTAPDFLRFSQMLLNKGELDGVRLLNAATVEAMTRNGLSDRVLKERGGSVGWGLANVDVVVAAGSRGYLTTIGEYGWDGSAGTFFAVDPSRELVVTLMTQNLPANPDGLRQKFKQAVLQSIVDGPPSQADDFDPDSLGTFSTPGTTACVAALAVDRRALAAGS